jgi:hypothetical protein
MFPPFYHPQAPNNDQVMPPKGGKRQPPTPASYPKEQQPQEDHRDDDDDEELWEEYWDSFAPDEQHDAALHILFTLDALIKQGMCF